MTDRIGAYDVLLPRKENKRLRQRSLTRLWQQEYKHYIKMTKKGYHQDTKTGTWKKHKKKRGGKYQAIAKNNKTNPKTKN